MTHKEIAEQVGALVMEKNAAYGAAFETSAKALELLYPKGVQPEQYTDLGLLIRIWDKMMRIATRKNAFNESPFRDIAGYGVLGAEKDERAALAVAAKLLSVEIVHAARGESHGTRSPNGEADTLGATEAGDHPGGRTARLESHL